MTELLNAVFGGNKTGSIGYHGNIVGEDLKSSYKNVMILR